MEAAPVVLPAFVVLILIGLYVDRRKGNWPFRRRKSKGEEN